MKGNSRGVGGGSNPKVPSMRGYGYFLEVDNKVVKNPKHLAPGLRQYASIQH